MSKLNLLLVSLLLTSTVSAENIWLDNNIKAVPENQATLYMKETPIQGKKGTWSAEIYDKKSNVLRITAKLTDPDVTKMKFIDNKFTFYCDSGCRQERIIIDNNTIEVWDYFSSGPLYRHFFIVKGYIDGTMEIFHGASSPIRTEEYKSGKKHGIERGYRNGYAYSETPYINGKIEGLQQERNDNKQLVKQTYYKDGKKEGEEKRWNNEGQLIEETNYKNGLLHGQYIRRNAKGIPIETGYYSEDKKQGEFDYYLDTGELIERKFFEQNRYAGMHELYSRWDNMPRYLMETKLYDDKHRLVENLFYEPNNVLSRKITITYKKNMEINTDISYKNKQIHYQEITTTDLKNNAKTSVNETFDDKQQLIGRSEYLNSQYHGLFISTNYYGGKDVRHYDHGKLHGEALITDENGEIIEKGRYKNNLKIGAWQKRRSFNNQATLIKENYNQKGELHGLYTEKTITGQVVTLGKYVNDKKVGNWIEHNRSKKININYDTDGKAHGGFIVTAANGKILEKGNYLHGKLHGRYIENDEMGNPVAEENYLNGELHGKFMLWLNSRLVTQGEYKNNKKNGYWLEYGSNNFAGRADICKGDYQQGLHVGKWQCFNSYGYLTRSLFFNTQGLLQGNTYIFNSQGMLESIAHYQEGLLDGTHKSYDQEGNEYISTYKNGEKLPDHK